MWGEWCPQTSQATVSTSMKRVDGEASSSVWGLAHAQSSGRLTQETLAITLGSHRATTVANILFVGFEGGVGDCPSADHQKCHIQTKDVWLCVYVSDPYCPIRRGFSVLNK